jgi:hypothetical protein
MHLLLVRAFAATLITAVLLGMNLSGEPVPVRYPQGSSHGFLALKRLDGTRIATGDATQIVHGDRVTSTVILRFLDGSIDEETTVFSQSGVFRLISDHHIQRGPSFPKPIDVLVEASGEVTSRTKEGKLRQDHLDLPPDVSNGLPFTLLMNVPPTAPETKLSFVAPTDKPRLVHLSVKPAGEVPFIVGGSKRTALDFVLHVELGGVAGVVAPLIGKQPPDYHIWILPGTSPALIREEGPLYEGGPILRIEQISPEFPR